VDGKTLRFDDHVGFHFALIMRPGVAAKVPSSLRQALVVIGVRCLELAGDGSTPGNAAVDTDGVYTQYLNSLAADAVIIRPDFVLFGSTHAEGMAALAQSLLDRLNATAQTA
jgi:hypothetical protein